MDAIFLHMAESSFTTMRQRGTKNMPQFSWRSPWKKRAIDAQTPGGLPRLLWQEGGRGFSASQGGRGQRVCRGAPQYLRECLKEIGDHLQGGLSSGLMFVTRARALAHGLAARAFTNNYWKKIKIICQCVSLFLQEKGSCIHFFNINTCIFLPSYPVLKCHFDKSPTFS